MTGNHVNEAPPMPTSPDPLTAEEAALLDDIDSIPPRMLRLVRVRLSRVSKSPVFQRHLRATLDALSADIDRAGFDEVEAAEWRSLAAHERADAKRSGTDPESRGGTPDAE